jgi:DNA polymerase-1
MIHLYDGNNVMLRAMQKPMIGQARPMSLRMRYEHCCAQPVGSQIWCWDGFGHNERRREIYPRYKTNRTPMADDMFSQIKLWKKCLTLSTATSIECQGWEADDVVSTLARRFARAGVRVTIHTNDMDYAQLLGLGNVTLDGVNTKDVPGRWVALYKAMVGDSSDFIAGIPGFGHKRWEAMQDHWPQIERAIAIGDPAGFVGLPFTKAVAAWLTEQENIDLLQNMLLVTHFINVPDDELEAGITHGEFNRAEAHNLLGKFFL